MNAPPPAPETAPFIRRTSYGWALAAVITAAAAGAAKLWLPTSWAVFIGLAATGFAVYALTWTLAYPRVHLGRGLALAALAASAGFAYAAFGEAVYNAVWRRTFQLTQELALYQDREEGWSISYPRLWTHEEQRAGDVVNHVFKPSKITPAMYFSVTTRPASGAADVGTLADVFLQNLPAEKDVRIHDKSRITLPDGRPAVRVVYSEVAGRIPLKNEVLFLLDKSRLYFLTAGASPRWFDRHRAYLERLLGTLRIP